MTISKEELLTKQSEIGTEAWRNLIPNVSVLLLDIGLTFVIIGLILYGIRVLALRGTNKITLKELVKSDLQKIVFWDKKSVEKRKEISKIEEAEGKKSLNASVSVIIFTVMIGTFITLGILGLRAFSYDIEEEKWETNYVEEYIKGLKDEKHDILHIKNVNYRVNLSSTFNHKSQWKGGRYEVIYEVDGKEVKKVLKAKVHYTLDEDEQPYITYKNLGWDISGDKQGFRGGYTIGYREGYYNAEVYLPKSLKDEKKK